MRQAKALIYLILGGMVAWTYWQRGNALMAFGILLFTLAVIGLVLSSIGRLKITWDATGIKLSTFPKAPQLLRWEDLEAVSLDHLGYHIKARNGAFRIRRKRMPESLLRRIKSEIKANRSKPTDQSAMR